MSIWDFPTKPAPGPGTRSKSRPTPSPRARRKISRIGTAILRHAAIGHRDHALRPRGDFGVVGDDDEGDAAGVELAANDDAPGPGESPSTEAFLEYTCASAGTYYLGISVEEFGGDDGMRLPARSQFPGFIDLIRTGDFKGAITEYQTYLARAKRGLLADADVHALVGMRAKLDALFARIVALNGADAVPVILPGRATPFRRHWLVNGAVPATEALNVAAPPTGTL